MTRDEIALRLFAAMISWPDAKVDIHPRLGEKQVRVAFELADTFMAVAAEDGPTDRFVNEAIERVSTTNEHEEA